MASVFISHRGADQVATERLARALRKRGHKVWLDIWQIQVGDSIVGRIDSCLSEASFLLLCCSGQLSTSSWTDREWMSALARQLGGAGVRLLPVRLTGGVLPSVLADVKYADLIADWSAGAGAICKAME